MKLFYLVSCFVLLGACSSSSSLKIKSIPSGAKVSTVESDGSLRMIGQTPLDTNERMQSFLVEKEAHEPARVFVGHLQNQHYEYSVKLSRKAEDPKVSDIKSRNERLAKTIARANYLINKKRYSEADSLLVGLTNEFPYVSVGYDLLGNISYLQRDFRRALNFYEKSLELNPENLETKQVLDRLKSMSN